MTPLTAELTTAPGIRGEHSAIERARHGDAEAIREIVRTNNRRLFRLARAVLRDDHDAEEVVQETYLRAFSHLDGFRGESSLSSWLTRIALNEALGRKRRTRFTVAIETLSEVAEDAVPMPRGPHSPEAAYGRTEVRALLQQAVDALPEPFRLVFMLRDVEGMSIEETSTVLQIRNETVKTRLFRARRLLRGSLQKEVRAGLADLFPFGGTRCDQLADAILHAIAERVVLRR